MNITVVPSTLVALAAVVLAGCDRPVNSGGPQTFSFVPSPPAAGATASIQPPTLPVIPTPIGGCPESSPLSTSLNLVVGAPGTTVLVDEIVLQVFDVNHVGGSPIVLTGSALAGMFGSAVVPAGATRTFALSPQFGCGLSTPAILTATLVLGGSSSPQTSVTVPFVR